MGKMLRCPYCWHDRVESMWDKHVGPYRRCEDCRFTWTRGRPEPGKKTKRKAERKA